MKNILILHDKAEEMYSFINYLVGNHAAVHTKACKDMKYDCIFVEEDLILNEDPVYLDLSCTYLCATNAMVVSLFGDEGPSEDDKIRTYANFQMAADCFLELNSKEAQDIFNVMWKVPIEWRKCCL